jgi:hypothetical protein
LPSTSNTVDFDYRILNASFSSDSDESDYPDSFDVAIVKYAAFLAWSSKK